MLDYCFILKVIINLFIHWLSCDVNVKFTKSEALNAQAHSDTCFVYEQTSVSQSWLQRAGLQHEKEK